MKCNKTRVYSYDFYSLKEHCAENSSNQFTSLVIAVTPYVSPCFISLLALLPPLLDGALRMPVLQASRVMALFCSDPSKNFPPQRLSQCLYIDLQRSQMISPSLLLWSSPLLLLPKSTPFQPPQTFWVFAFALLLPGIILPRNLRTCSVIFFKDAMRPPGYLQKWHLSHCPAALPGSFSWL